MNRYKHLEPVSNKIWQGRIDDTEDFESFRWHQWVQPIDIEEMKEPLKDDLSFCFIGFCCDKGVQRNKGRMGASKGPDSIRREMANLPCHFKSAVGLYDAGNIIAKHLELEEAQDALAKIVSEITSLNMFPIVLGGGHEIAYGHYNGLKHLSDKLGVVNFDAHLDIRPYPDGGSSGTMFRQIYDDCKKEKKHYDYMCIGAQKRSNTLRLFKDAHAMKMNYILAKDITDVPVDILNGFTRKQEKLYITICSDVFASSFAPGVSATQPLGLEPEVVIKMIKHLIYTGKVIGFDIAEVSPRFDHDRVTSNLAAVLIFAVINTLSEMKELMMNIPWG